MGRSTGLDIIAADIEELAEDPKEVLTMEELTELHSEQQKVLVEKHPLRKRKTRRRLTMM